MCDSLWRIHFLLNRLNKKMDTIVMKDVINCGLTLSEIMVLRQVNKEPKTTGHISKILGLSYSTVSGLIDRLERKHLVERVRDVEDRRVVWVHKTVEYEPFIQKFPKVKDIEAEDVFKGLTPKELEEFVMSLQAIDNSM